MRTLISHVAVWIAVVLLTWVIGPLMRRFGVEVEWDEKEWCDRQW